jgi:hypothetical protein
MITLSDPIQAVLCIWGLVGLLVAVGFLVLGFDKVDEAAHGAYAVRPLLVPGLVLLWPLVIWRWIALSRRER